MAAEKPFTGLTGSVKIGPKPTQVLLGYVSGVDLNISKDIIEILAYGMSYKEKVPAIKDWSASINGTVALVGGGSQETLYKAFDSGEPITLGVFLDETTYFEGSAYVQNFNVTSSPDDKVNLSSELAGSGALTLTVPGSV